MITKTRQNYRVLLPGLLLGLTAFITLVFLSSLPRVVTLFSSFKWVYFAAAVGLNFVHHALRFLNLSFSLNFSGIRRIPLGKRMVYYLSSSALTAADPPFQLSADRRRPQNQRVLPLGLAQQSLQHPAHPPGFHPPH